MKYMKKEKKTHNKNELKLKREWNYENRIIDRSTSIN